MYTRYLGDLFGGQMMSGMATRSLKLEGGEGVEFYRFPDITDNKAFIEEWYTTGMIILGLLKLFEDEILST